MRSGSVVVHQTRLTGVGPETGFAVGDDAADVAESPVVGLVVSRTVGGSVVRHRVSRRLRAQLSARLDLLPLGSGTVVRALPASASASSAALGADLDRALTRLTGAR